MIYDKSEPLAPLDCTGEVIEQELVPTAPFVTALDGANTKAALDKLEAQGIEALTVSLINSFTNPAHEQRVAE